MLSIREFWCHAICLSFLWKHSRPFKLLLKTCVFAHYYGNILDPSHNTATKSK